MRKVSEVAGTRQGARGPRSSPSRLGVRVDDTRDLYLDQTNGMDLEKVLTQSCDIEHSTFSFREV